MGLSNGFAIAENLAHQMLESNPPGL